MFSDSSYNPDVLFPRDHNLTRMRAEITSSVVDLTLAILAGLAVSPLGRKVTDRFESLHTIRRESEFDPDEQMERQNHLYGIYT